MIRMIACSVKECGLVSEYTYIQRL